MSASAAALKADNRRTRPLAAVERCYLIGRRHMLSEMSPEQQAKIREAYNETGFVVEGAYSLELYEVCTDFESAVEKASGYENGFWLELPVGAPLPHTLGRYMPEGHPKSESEHWYQETNPDRYEGSLSKLEALNLHLGCAVNRARELNAAR